jgi:hypothetical protein
MILLGVVAGLPAFAQTTEKVERRTENRMVFSGVAGPGEMRHTIEFRSQLVKGAPYSAESVTETTQMLADGNRIVNRQTGKEYRDSEGRTRRDNTVQPMGPWVAEGKSSSISVIDDPIAGEHFTLNHAEKTASKMKMPRIEHAIQVAEGEKKVQREIQVEVRKEMSSTSTVTVDSSHPGEAHVMMWTQQDGAGPGAAKTESLGKRVIEGVECEGTKEVVTIEAGKIGNDRPIEIVTERWSSPELKLDVLRKHSDPRFGETNYRLQGVVRGEQPRSLFEAPSDYKAEGVMGPGSEVRVFQRKAKQ